MARQRPGHTHLETAREAGLSRFSLVSILAGLVTAYGTFAVFAAIAGAIAEAADADTEFRTNDWTGSGAVAALISAAVLLLAYLFGGYVAGRMARRAGLLHGVLVAVTSLVVGAVVGGVVGALADSAEVERNLRSIGVPTDTDQLTGVAVASVIVSLVAMLAGGALGGLLGERWHTKLAARADDDAYGPAAEARARAEREDEDHDRRIDADPVAHDARHDGLVGHDGHADRGTDLARDRDRDRDRQDARRDEQIDLRETNRADRADRDPGEARDEPRYTAEEWRRMAAERQSPTR